MNFSINQCDSSEIHESLYLISIIKDMLNETKSTLDTIYNNKHANEIMRLFDPFRKQKYTIAKQIRTYNITNAWLKCYELLYTHNLIPMDKFLNNFVYFDNASFPGSFILATNHFVKTLTNIKTFEWYASSLLTNTDINKTPLEDSYNLYSNYPNNWLMDEKNNGDIAQIDNILDFQNKISKKHRETKTDRVIDLYTCDLGTDVSNDYNAQESTHFLLSICQIVCGLVTLKSGGHMVVKLYTIFEIFTISYISLLKQLFSEVIISKPLTSKRTNSEIYLVCKNYQFPFTSYRQKIYDLFIERVRNKDLTPLTSAMHISEMTDIYNASKNIFCNQNDSLNHFIHTVNDYDNEILRKKNQMIISNENGRIIKQFNEIPIYSINKFEQLRMTKKY